MLSNLGTNSDKYFETHLSLFNNVIRITAGKSSTLEHVHNLGFTKESFVYNLELTSQFSYQERTDPFCFQLCDAEKLHVFQTKS